MNAESRALVGKFEARGLSRRELVAADTKGRSVRVGEGGEHRLAEVLAMMTVAAGMVTASPTRKRTRLLIPIIADQERDAPERQDGRHPQPDEESLFAVSREPECDGEEKRDEGGAENGQCGTAAQGAA